MLSLLRRGETLDDNLLDKIKIWVAVLAAAHNHI